ncbi:putative uncharacterized protein [Clostridium sp. CAG:452]|nr:putative uncharacterized protein [Clostridium sp. CAG:452]
MDGYLKIKTKIDNKDVDKGIEELENKVKKLQEDNSKSGTEQNLLQKELENYKELQAKADSYKQKIKELKAEKMAMFKNNSALAVSVDTPEYANIKAQIADMKQKYTQATAEIDKQSPKIEKVYSKLDKIKAKQTENNAKIQQFKSKIESIKANNVRSSIDGIGKSITGQISKIGKMAIAVVGIRTAWGAVRSAINLVSQYNPQMSADLQYMGYCIANIVAPAVQWLTRLLYTALSYINAIMQAWFGINIFANSSAKAFKKMQSSAGGTAKSAKEIQKSLQGFDEMNVLSDNSNDSSGGSGIATPSMDLSNMQGEIPEWLKWIIDNKDLILSVISGITVGLLAWKLGLDGIKALGIGVLISGIVYTIQSLISYLNDGSWENFGKIIQGIGVALLGLAIVIGSVPLAVAGAITLIVGTIVKYWEQIKAFLQNGIDWLTGKSDWVHEMFGDTIGNIYDMFVNSLQNLLNLFDSIFTMVKGIFDGFIMFIKGVFTGDWKMAWEGIKKIFTSIWEGIKGVFFAVWNQIKNVVATVGKTVGNIIANTFKAVVNGVLRAIESILNFPIKSINRLIGVINNVPGINLGYLSTFNLPRLAKGGIISQPTQAIIGEAGREAVVPLENNMEWLDILADKLASKIGGNGGSYIINMDGRVIQRGIAKRQQELAFVRNGR